ncbi:TetR/AcrR family transcriptional regulator [Reyranella sp. CPCC 100927]|uniref:TetR/AcrR family transcriptional regulator n=1 Tax=Reyranella sp. CPCC 100927 TaxID=2599616 RepID=UPI0011B614C4|nr:TetR/AcrR family transcriptional regulator [Reyranella sp. CPCC 100927]TWT08650.1 TetR/AcrR family transcriptional regulator [Reyranella sp. CPCC 100927]
MAVTLKLKLKLKQQRSQERHRRILDAATRVFGDRGLAVASLTDVARAAGVPLPSIYDYFADKEDLIANVPARNFEELYEILDRQADEGSCRDRLHRLYTATFSYIVGNPSWGRVFFLEIWPSVLAEHPTIRRSIDDYARRYIDLLEEGVARREFRRDLDPHLAMSLLMGAMCHLTAVWLLYGKRFDLRMKGAAAFAALSPTFAKRRRS